MFENSLSDWRKILLVKEEPLSEIFVLSPENSEELRGSEELGAPSFIRMLSKRWCQWKVFKGGRRLFAPPLLPRRKARKKDYGEHIKN